MRKRLKKLSKKGLHEVYKIAIAREGREIAKLKVADLRRGFEIVPVDDQIAELSAELGHKYGLSMGDSIIAATALMLNAICFSDDPHFKRIKEIKTVWI
jgi:predicted nucleic acid-binding protein